MQIFNLNKTRLFEKINAQTRSKSVRKEIINCTGNFAKTDNGNPKNKVLCRGQCCTVRT